MNTLTKCIFCGGSKCQLAFSATDFVGSFSTEKFSYCLCQDCGTTFLKDIPEDIASYYSKSAYAAYQKKYTHKQEMKIRGFEADKLAMLKTYLSKGRVLEIGPGSGEFLKSLQTSNFEPFALEMDSTCVEHINNELHIPAIHSNVPWLDISKHSLKFDAIVLWQVIEHLNQPAQMLASIAKQLTAGGIVIIAAPNPRAWSFRLFQSYWAHLDAPRHLSLIPETAIDRAMEKLGLIKMKTVSSGYLRAHLNQMAWQSSLVNLTQSKGLAQIFLKCIGRLLHYVCYPFECYFESSACYTGIYQARALDSGHRKND